MLAALVLALGSSQEADVDALVRALGAEEPAARVEAERKLTGMGRRALPALRKAAEAGDAETSGRARVLLERLSLELRLESLYAAGMRPETVAAGRELPRRLASADPRELAGALEELGGRASADELAALAAVYGPAELAPEVRRAFAEILRRRKAPGLAPCVVPMLRSANREDRTTALHALAEAKAVAAIPDILPCLADPDVFRDAYLALDALEAPIPAAALRTALDSDDEGVRLRAVHAAENRPAPDLAPSLVRALLRATIDPWDIERVLVNCAPTWADLRPLLQSPSEYGRAAAIRISRRLRMPEALDAAFALLDDPAERNRTEALEILAAWGGPEPRRRLLERRDAAALRALACLGGPDARTRAEEALASKAAPLRAAGLAALRILDAHDAAPRIAAFLDDPEPEVRAEAARILPHLGGDGVGPALATRLAKESDPAALARLLDAVGETGAREAAPRVLAWLRTAPEPVMPSAVRAAGALRLQEAAPVLVEGYLGLRGGGFPNAYEALIQIRPPGLVDRLRPHLKPPEPPKDDPLDAFRPPPPSDRGAARAAAYLLYVDAPGASECFLDGLRAGLPEFAPVGGSFFFFTAGEALPWLLEQIEQGLWTDESEARRYLLAYGGPELPGRARAWLGHRLPGPRALGADLLRALKAGPVPELKRLLDDPHEKVRIAAARTLARAGEREAVRAYLERLPPPDRLHLLDWLDDAWAVAQAEALLDHEEADVREEAAETIYRMGAKTAFPKLLRSYRERGGREAWCWAHAFGQLGGAEGAAALREILDRSRDPEWRKAAVAALAQSKAWEPRDRARVAGWLGDPSVGREGWEAYARMDPEGFVARLSDPLERLSLPPGNWADCLRRAPRATAVGGWIILLEHGGPQDRAAAAVQLGRAGAVEAREALARAVHAEDPGLRRQAAVALVRLGDRRGLDELRRLPRTEPRAWVWDALLAPNLLRRPEDARALLAPQWTCEEGRRWTLREALQDLARRSGMKLALSPSLSERGLRSRPAWESNEWSAERILETWARHAAFVVEPGELRVLTPEDAWRFWTAWSSP